MISFYHSIDNCQAGICKKAYPIDNITFYKKPIIHDKCIRCGSCSHNCPQNTIRYRDERSRDRYRNVNASLAEIINTNTSR